MSSASKPQKQLVADAERRHAEDAARERRVGRLAQALLVGVAGRIDARRELCRERRDALRILGVGATAPDVAQAPARRRSRLGVPCSGAGGPGEPRQRERVERMASRRVDRDAGAMREPVNLAEGPGALRLDLGRALVVEGLQSAPKTIGRYATRYERPTKASEVARTRDTRTAKPDRTRTRPESRCGGAAGGSSAPLRRHADRVRHDARAGASRPRA
jgi:hypothetical protein